MVSWRALVKTILLVACGAALPAVAQDVYFQSKMPADWLQQQPATNESLELSLMRLIFAHNTELKPHFAQVNHVKASELTRSSPDSCMAAILKNPDRAEEFLFSQPFSSVEGLKLFLPKSSKWQQNIKQKQKLGQGKVSVRELLLTEPDFVLGLDSERSYGPELDLLFRERVLSRSLYFKQSGAKIAQLWPMLQQGRVSAVLEFPFMLATTDGDELEGYAITEAEPLQLAYFACNKSETGQRIIQQLNRSISALAGTKAYLDLHLKTVAPELQPAFVKHYQRLMLGQNPPS